MCQKPFNTDQGAQFTSDDWLDTLKAADVQISMDGKGRWIDNVFIERPWRSVKYEEVYLHAYENGSEARVGLAKYFEFYNARRTHQSHDYRTPDAVYFAGTTIALPRRKRHESRCREIPGASAGFAGRPPWV